MFEGLVNASDLQKGLFLMLVGILGVFFVLIVFYFLMKVLVKVFPDKEASE